MFSRGGADVTTSLLFFVIPRARASPAVLGFFRRRGLSFAQNTSATGLDDYTFFPFPRWKGAFHPRPKASLSLLVKTQVLCFAASRSSVEPTLFKVHRKGSLAFTRRRMAISSEDSPCSPQTNTGPPCTSARRGHCQAIKLQLAPSSDRIASPHWLESDGAPHARFACTTRVLKVAISHKFKLRPSRIATASVPAWGCRLPHFPLTLAC